MLATLFAGAAGAAEPFATWTQKTERITQQDGWDMIITMSGQGLPMIKGVAQYRGVVQEKVGIPEVTVDGDKLASTYDPKDQIPTGVSGSKGSLKLTKIGDIANDTRTLFTYKGTINGKPVVLKIAMQDDATGNTYMAYAVRSSEGTTTAMITTLDSVSTIVTGAKSEVNITAIAYAFGSGLQSPY